MEQLPYLINGQGKPLVNPSAYEQYFGASPVIGPFENGWAIISNAEETKFNYINEIGELFSSLLFARAIPFYGQYTVAYVDTGVLTNPEERYMLYILNADGDMERWQYTGDTQGVVGAVGGLALLQSGELVSLKDIQTICMTDSVFAYLDCDAMVVRDMASGKYGLFVKGEQLNDFAYDRIQPVACDMQWKQIGELNFNLCAITEAAYPQPLSHYFTLEKDGAEDLVALSTRSIFPVVLK